MSEPTNIATEEEDQLLNTYWPREWQRQFSTLSSDQVTTFLLLSPLPPQSTLSIYSQHSLFQAGREKTNHESCVKWITSLTTHINYWLENSFFNPNSRICLLIFRERKRTMWERSIDQLPPIHTPTKNWTHNIGMCSNQKLNPQPFCCLRGHSNQLSNPARTALYWMKVAKKCTRHPNFYLWTRGKWVQK